jgi:tRNA threonylcarbamoyladenosine modification (KEOPS) complex Cgi121 subunit
MRYQIEEYGKHVEITGYRPVAFAKAEAFLKTKRQQTHGAQVQFFDADLIATHQHLYFATLNALQAFKGKTNLSKSPAMETMLYASAQRQIQKAIDRCGIKPQTKNMAVLIISEDPKQIDEAVREVAAFVCVEPDESVLDLNEAKAQTIQSAFGITDLEIKTIDSSPHWAIVSLVIERVAVLATQL